MNSINKAPVLQIIN